MRSVAQLGFAALAMLWLYTGSRAYLAVRRSAIAEHRKWMVRNFSLTFSAVTLRLYLPMSMAAGVEFSQAYPALHGCAGCRTWRSQNGDTTPLTTTRLRRTHISGAPVNASRFAKF